ncbi:anomalous homeobox protein [Python bivittatus]|uniref:Anomalous homeobox protein n=1 Tax=Python bivittatus TaxID=176946 RepID=A0A9F5N720_PYTBI|nr:anomalous homeobox protein [Python bivittatus]
MKQFMVLLQKSDLQDVPPSELRDEAGRLCQRLQHSPAGLEKLVRAMVQGRHWPHLCTSLQVVQAFVSVHLQKNQHDMACKLLEGCAAIEREQLVKLWHEIHYHKTMEKQQTTSLTPVQKYRCRKRNPPPASLCPDGVKNRNYPLDVRERLRRFAMEVTTNPSRKQRVGGQLPSGGFLRSFHIAAALWRLCGREILAVEGCSLSPGLSRRQGRGLRPDEHTEVGFFILSLKSADGRA